MSVVCRECGGGLTEMRKYEEIILCRGCFLTLVEEEDIIINNEFPEQYWEKLKIVTVKVPVDKLNRFIYELDRFKTIMCDNIKNMMEGD